MRRRVRVDDGAFEAIVAQLEGSAVGPRSSCLWTLPVQGRERHRSSVSEMRGLRVPGAVQGPCAILTVLDASRAEDVVFQRSVHGCTVLL